MAEYSKPWTGVVEWRLASPHHVVGSNGEIVSLFNDNIRRIKPCVSKDGYARVHLRRNSTKTVHRIVGDAFFPAGFQEVDHINRNKSDNRLDNLRPATVSQNRSNVIRKHRACKFRGVVKKRHRFAAQITSNGVNTYIGTFDTQEEAAVAYNRSASVHHGQFATLNILSDLP